MSTPTIERIPRRLEGEVVSAKTDKTRIVLVTRTLAHAKYGKRMVTSTRYASHDETNAAKLGDKVTIEQTRPMSRTKRWRIIKILS